MNSQHAHFGLDIDVKNSFPSLFSILAHMNTRPILRVFQYILTWIQKARILFLRNKQVAQPLPACCAQPSWEEPVCGAQHDSRVRTSCVIFIHARRATLREQSVLYILSLNSFICAGLHTMQRACLPAVLALSFTHAHMFIFISARMIDYTLILVCIQPAVLDLVTTRQRTCFSAGFCPWRACSYIWRTRRWLGPGRWRFGFGRYWRWWNKFGKNNYILSNTH